MCDVSILLCGCTQHTEGIWGQVPGQEAHRHVTNGSWDQIYNPPATLPKESQLFFKINLLNCSQQVSVNKFFLTRSQCFLTFSMHTHAFIIPHTHQQKKKNNTVVYLLSSSSWRVIWRWHMCRMERWYKVFNLFPVIIGFHLSMKWKYSGWHWMIFSP